MQVPHLLMLIMIKAPIFQQQFGKSEYPVKGCAQFM